MSPLTAADDGFHPVADPDPMWTETTWWGLVVPDRSLGGQIYTLFRPNLGVASLVVQVWDASAVEPWLVPYARTLWHVPYPDTDLTRCQVADLSIECIEPLTKYHLSFNDRDLLSFDLDYVALAPPDEASVGGGSGHFDQACRVVGDLHSGPETIGVDASVVRDRSWYVRRDQRSLREGYTYGIVDASEHCVAHSFAAPDATEDETTILSGYFVRDGHKAKLVAGTRRVLARRRGHPDVIELVATDADGRELIATARTLASLASQSTPGMFSWMSVAEWDIAGRAAHGEDHDVWSPDLLAKRSSDVRSGRPPAS